MIQGLIFEEGCVLMTISGEWLLTTMHRAASSSAASLAVSDLMIPDLNKLKCVVERGGLHP